ncbi:hypothetical protein GLAREA_02956 [Glarea lozoyensis ATCC 20868]|uniref:Uncharacterized protein n=1 Tax=Glarea lozoyensis (strain ATCC 20868 / MF5171) TaxID=1116229 RepID=S3CKI4_GLAL2|nr:uncharacterized protein GLAREA_02956 [Glarea lozoyensis ATCC 20868]EPE27042.1 hypothetical protein GLAREA_02956 [Glarea lozoyensis ATCC 20868]
MTNNSGLRGYYHPPLPPPLPATYALMPLLPDFSPTDYLINWPPSHLNTITMLPDLIFPVLDLPIQPHLDPTAAQGTLPNLFCGNPCYCYKKTCAFASRGGFGKYCGGRKGPVVLPVKASGEGDGGSFGFMAWFAKFCGMRKGKKNSGAGLEAGEASVEADDETTPLLGGR